jgi:hypothetical protein
VARQKHAQLIRLPQANEESDLTLLSEEEKAFLRETYGIAFATPDTLEEELSAQRSGTDLRMVLLFSLILLALTESWLSNRLASL